MKPVYNNQDYHGTLWRRIATGDSAADASSRGQIGHLWRDNADRPVLGTAALRARCRVVFGKQRLLRAGVFGLLRRRGFSLSPERYLRRPLFSPLQITLARNGAATIHHGHSLLRPLSVVNNNTTRHKTSRYQQLNQHFTRQWHDHRQLNVISHAGFAAPVMRSAVALRLVQGQRILLRLLGHTQTASGILTTDVERFWGGVADLTAIARLVMRTLPSNTHGNIAQTVLPFALPQTGKPAGVGMTDQDALRDTLIAFTSARRGTGGTRETWRSPVMQPAGHHLHRRGVWQAAPLLRMSRLSLPVPLPAMVAHAHRRGKQWRSAGAHNLSSHHRWLSLFAELSPLSALSASRLPPEAAATVSQRMPRGIARRPALWRNRDRLSGKPSGFILAARDSTRLSGIVAAMREQVSDSAALRDLALNRALPVPGSLSRRRQSLTLTEHGQSIQRQQMRAQHAIAELCHNQERQRQEFHRRDERIFTELRQQLQALQRSSSHEQAVLLKAVQSLERVLTQTLKTTPAPALRPLSFLGNP